MFKGWKHLIGRWAVLALYSVGFNAYYVLTQYDIVVKITDVQTIPRERLQDPHAQQNIETFYKL